MNYNSLKFFNLYSTRRHVSAHKQQSPGQRSEQRSSADNGVINTSTIPDSIGFRRACEAPSHLPRQPAPSPPGGRTILFVYSTGRMDLCLQSFLPGSPGSQAREQGTEAAYTHRGPLGTGNTLRSGKRGIKSERYRREGKRICNHQSKLLKDTLRYGMMAQGNPVACCCPLLISFTHSFQSYLLLRDQAGRLSEQAKQNSFIFMPV